MNESKQLIIIIDNPKIMSTVARINSTFNSVGEFPIINSDASEVFQQLVSGINNILLLNPSI
jgi:hypothetical protein